MTQGRESARGDWSQCRPAAHERRRGMVDDLIAYRAQKSATDRPEAARPDDHEVGPDVVGLLPQVGSRSAGEGLYIHLGMFGIVNLALFAINMVTNPDVLWFYWPLLGWGGGPPFISSYS